MLKTFRSIAMGFINAVSAFHAELDHRVRKPCMFQDASGVASAQYASVVGAVSAGKGRGDEREQLVADVGPARFCAQVKTLVGKFSQIQAIGRGDGQQQSGVGHQALLVEGDPDAVGARNW